MGRLGGVLRRLGAACGASWLDLKTISGRLWRVMGTSRHVLTHLECVLARLGAFWVSTRRPDLPGSVELRVEFIYRYGRPARHITSGLDS